MNASQVVGNRAELDPNVKNVNALNVNVKGVNGIRAYTVPHYQHTNCLMKH